MYVLKKEGKERIRGERRRGILTSMAVREGLEKKKDK